MRVCRQTFIVCLILFYFYSFYISKSRFYNFFLLYTVKNENHQRCLMVQEVSHYEAHFDEILVTFRLCMLN